MPLSSIINQPFSGTAGDYITNALDNGTFNQLQMAVAFAKTSGVLRLKRPIEDFRTRGGKVRAFIGIDLDGTSYEALSNLYSFVDELYVVHLEGSQTYHPKIYNFIGRSQSIAFVGSHNLTLGGLWKNIESGLALQLDISTDADAAIQQEISFYFDQLTDLDGASLKIDSPETIDALRDAGYINYEVAIRKARKQNAAASKRSSSTKLFLTSIKAPAPSIQTENSVPDVPAPDRATGKLPAKATSIAANHTNNPTVYQTFWFQSGNMTGGSRNQLDLSMKALLENGSVSGTEYATDKPNMMKGGLYFFGLDEATSKKKDNWVTILYDGKDFEKNEIKLYGGTSNPNGTWRLNLKGETADGVSFLDQLKERYPATDTPLVGKVLVFERIAVNYYALTIFEGSDLESFKAASEIVGRNGTTRGSKNRPTRFVGVY